MRIGGLTDPVGKTAHNRDLVPVSELSSLQNVDAIYVGTPHTYHHANAKAAMLAGKHVLCEKPITFDMAELDELIAIAKEKNVFFMEWVFGSFCVPSGLHHRSPLITSYSRSLRRRR